MTSSSALMNIEIEAARFGIVKIPRLGGSVNSGRVTWKVRCSKCPREYSAYWHVDTSPELMVKNLRTRHWDIGRGDRPLCPECAHAKDKAPTPKPAGQSFKPYVDPSLAGRMTTMGKALAAAVEVAEKKDIAAETARVLQAEPVSTLEPQVWKRVKNYDKPSPLIERIVLGHKRNPDLTKAQLARVLHISDASVHVAAKMFNLTFRMGRPPRVPQVPGQPRKPSAVVEKILQTHEANPDMQIKELAKIAGCDPSYLYQVEHQWDVKFPREKAVRKRLSKPVEKLPAPVSKTVEVAHQEQEVGNKTMPTPSIKITIAVHQLLESVFDDNKRIYKMGYNDERVAKEVGTTTEIVADIRKQVHGELAEDPRMSALRDDVELLRMEWAEFKGKIEPALRDLHSRVEQAIRNVVR